MVTFSTYGIRFSLAIPLSTYGVHLFVAVPLYTNDNHLYVVVSFSPYGISLCVEVPFFTCDTHLFVVVTFFTYCICLCVVVTLYIIHVMFVPLLWHNDIYLCVVDVTFGTILHMSCSSLCCDTRTAIFVWWMPHLVTFSTCNARLSVVAQWHLSLCSGWHIWYHSPHVMLVSLLWHNDIYLCVVDGTFGTILHM